jgi:predicted nucleic acid-binding protein
MLRRPERRPAPALGPVLVDASAWLALVSSSDGRHAEAELAFTGLRRQKLPLLTTNLVLAEVH